MLDIVSLLSERAFGRYSLADVKRLGNNSSDVSDEPYTDVSSTAIVARSVFGMWGSYYFVGARAALAIIWYGVQRKSHPPKQNT